MKNHKIWNILGFVLVILAILAGTYVSVVGVGEKHQGSAQNIKLGLDLAGGVSITYEANESNPSAEDMRDTALRLRFIRKAQTGSTWRSPAFTMLRKFWKPLEIRERSNFMKRPQTVTAA